MRVEVVYARPERQALYTVEVAPGSTAADAVRASGLSEAFPEIDPAHGPLGVFGVQCAPDTVLRAGDRVEIYRPLQVHPREARRRRAGFRGHGQRG